MLNNDLHNALNEQVESEAFASQYYLAMASWCEQKGFKGSAQFFYTQSDEERGHMRKLMDFINEEEGKAIAPAVKQPPQEYESVAQIVGLALEHEKKVTVAINKLVEMAQKLNDHAAFAFLQWFVEEQREEETQFRDLGDVIKMVGTEGQGLYLLDQEFAKKAAKNSAASGK